jgi:hemoglobin
MESAQTFRESVQDWLSSCNRSLLGVEDQQAMSEQTTRGAVSDYEIIGGGSAVSAVVNDFYGRVLGDSQLAPYFEEVDLARLKRHQVLLVTKLLGGPDNYTGRPLDEAHDGLGITHDDLAAVVSHFAAAMKAAGAADDIVLRAVRGCRQRARHRRGGVVRDLIPRPQRRLGNCHGARATDVPAVLLLSSASG